MPITKGNWKAKENSDGSWVVMSGSIVIALFDRKDQPERNESNARLIAAAPDLLTACKNIAKFLEQIGGAELNLLGMKHKADGQASTKMFQLEQAIIKAKTTPEVKK